MCVYVSRQFYSMCRVMEPLVQSRHRTVASPHRSSLRLPTLCTYILPSLYLGNHSSVSISVVISQMLHEWNHRVYSLLGLTYFAGPLRSIQNVACICSWEGQSLSSHWPIKLFHFLFLPYCIG